MKLKFNHLLILALLFSSITLAQEKTVTGNVTDDQGLPLPGVNIVVKGTTRGMQTDFNGSYSIRASADQTLVFTYIGFKTVERLIGTLNTINVQMEVDAQTLEEVVIVGAFRNLDRDAVVGSAETVDNKVFEEIPVTSFDNLLQGNATGLNVTASNGNPGAAANINIRGLASPTGGNGPIYILDGVRITAANISRLNPNDFESVTVLKDAGSAALYGARGANGVILITTRKGSKSEQKATISYDASYGISSVSDNNFDLLSGSEFRTFQNIIAPGSFTQEQIDNAPNTNWQNVLFRDAIQTSHALSFSGGNQTTSYFLSGSYFKQEGTLPRSNLERTTLRVNLDSDVRDWWNVGVNIQLSHVLDNRTDDFGINTNSPVAQAYVNRPDAEVFNPDGSFNTQGLSFGFNALEQIELNDDQEDRIGLNGSLFSTIKFNDRLSYSIILGLDFRELSRKRFFAPETNLGQQANNGQLLQDRDRFWTLTHTSKILYDVPIHEDHSLKLLGVFDFERQRNTTFDTDAQDFDFPQLRENNAATSFVDINGDTFNGTYVSYAANVDYSYKQKYFFNGSFTIAADSDFGTDDKFGEFFGIGGSWVISRESFLQDSSWLNYLKLRASYGENGNNQSATALGSRNFATNATFNGNAALRQPANINDPELTWETVKGINLGVDYTLFNRIRGTIDVYRNETEDVILQEPVPTSTTFTQITRNSSDFEVINQGIELSVSADIVKNKNFGLEVGGNISYNDNKVEGEERRDVFAGNSTFGGGNITSNFTLVRYAGVDPLNGEQLYLDANGNLTTTFNDAADAVVLDKQAIAPINGGFYTNFRYKTFEIDARFSFQLDKYTYNNSRFFFENPSAFSNFNQNRVVLNIWQQPGDITNIPRFGEAATFDDRFLENSSFLRLRTLTLSYNLPQKFIEDIGLSRFRVFVQGQNLLTWTDYSGLDPEFDDRFEGFDFPVPRTFLFGVNIQL